MKTINYIFSIALLFTLFACEKSIVIDSRETTGSVVIEGLITNQVDKQYVKVSRTVSFYESGATPRITNAIVTVADDLGNEMPFIHNPTGEEATAGYYYPSGNFVGEIGQTYTLRVTIGSEVYEAQDELLYVTTIDSLSYRVNEDEKDDPKIAGKYYELLAYMKEPQETTDYYLFKFYRNDSVTYYLKNSDIYFTNDVGITEDIDGIPSPVYYGANDTAKMEIYSLTRNAFLFYNDLFNLINSDGGMISPPPANPRGNVSNGALGFFRASAVNSASTVIEHVD